MNTYNVYTRQTLYLCITFSVRVYCLSNCIQHLSLVFASGISISINGSKIGADICMSASISIRTNLMLMSIFAYAYVAGENLVLAGKNLVLISDKRNLI